MNDGDRRADGGDDWENTLAECEARLDAAAASGAAATEIAPFVAPALTGPLPASLEPRARAIVDRGEALERRLTGEQEHILTELRRLPKMPPPRHTSRFDTRA